MPFGLKKMDPEHSQKNKTLPLAVKIILFFLGFAFILAILFLLWYPIAPYYLFARYWAGYKLLNLVGFYPPFTPSANPYIQGEYFSFLPFLSLMICTYKKKVLKEWKTLLVVFILVVLMEITGKFFERFHQLRPQYITYVLSIFLLASARVAVPFLAWWHSMEKNKIHLFN